jgi:hypothetical protein
MKRRGLILFAFTLIFSMIFSVSAEIVFSQQPNEVYNLGDSINLPVTVKALSDISDNLYLNLICEGNQIRFFENGVDLQAGQEVGMVAVLSKNAIGLQTGKCKIKAILGEDYALTNDFEISNLIIVQSNIEKTVFNPGETIVFNGDAFKSNGDGANGFVKFSIVTRENSSSLEQIGTVSEGHFSINLNIPSNLQAGAYLVVVEIYELNSENVRTNTGFMNYNINVNQIPTSLEVFLERNEIEPGAIVKAKAILHDQTGEKIDSFAILTLRKSNNEIVKQVELPTDEFFEFEIAYNEIPSNWSVFAVSNRLNSEMNFIIMENKDISVDIMNGTVVFTNRGNVPYNDSVLLKLGENSSIKVNINLAIDEVKKYEIRAPNGEYSIEVISNGKSKFNSNVILTGRSIDLRELKSFELSSVGFIIWIFVILVLGCAVFLIIKKGCRKTFFGKFNMNRKYESVKKSKVDSSTNEEFLIKTANRAILSLSIKGDKQESSLICLKIKNSLDRKGVSETMQKIAKFAESKKAMIYENNDSIFFIFSALKTKTFRNERSTIELSQEINEILNYHNKLFKHKIDAGMSLDSGYIVSKINSQGELEFMSMGNLIPNLKKIASLSTGEILMSKEFKDKAGSIIKAQDKTIESVKVYTIREMRDREKYNKFIGTFLNNLERDKKEREKRENKGI